MAGSVFSWLGAQTPVLGPVGRISIHEQKNRPLLPLPLDPDIEVDALAVDDDLTLADVGLRDDPVTQHHGPLEGNLQRELNSLTPVREMEMGVVSASHHEGSSTPFRRGSP
jgi:hypothetical protein